MSKFTANMASLRGVGWVHQDQGHTGVDRLVGDELSKLEETPTLLPIAVYLADPGAIPDAGEVFQCDGSTGGLGFVHDAATDVVVDCPLVSLLPPRQPFQEPLGSLRAFGLVGSSHLGIVAANSVDLGGLVGGPVGIDGDSATPQINTERPLRFDRVRSVVGQLDMEEVGPAATLDQDRGGGLATFQERLLPPAKLGRQFDSAAEQSSSRDSAARRDSAIS
jgi:hypothetical protein